MSKLFGENIELLIKGKILTREQIQLFSDGEYSFDEFKMGELLAKAEGFLEQPIPLLPLSLYRDCWKTGNRWRFEGPHHRRREMLLTLSLCEAYEKKGRFIEKMADVIWAMLEESTWVIPAHTYHSKSRPNTDVPEVFGNNALHAIDLYAGSASANLALALYLHREELEKISPIIPARIEYQLMDRLIKPYINSTFFWSGDMGGNAMNNWCPQIVSNVLLVTALTVPDKYTRELVTAKALGHLERFFSSYPEDGSCDEGAGYWAGAAGCLFDALEILYDMTGGAVDLFGNSKLRIMGEFVSKMNIDGDWYVNFADCGAHFVHDGYLIERFGRRCRSDEMITFGRRSAKGRACEENTFRMPYRVMKNYQSPMVTEADVTRAAPMVWFPGHEIAITRESTDTSQGFFLAAKGGHNGEMHNHIDVGCFIVFYCGKPVIIDPGIGLYVKFHDWYDRYRKNWHMRSPYHNLPTFGDVEQMWGREMRAELDSYNSETGALTLELKGAYPSDSGIISFKRKSELRDGCVRINDSVRLEEKKEIVFYLMTRDEPMLNSDGTVALAEGRTLIYPKALKFAKERVEGGNFRYEAIWERDSLWRMSFSVTASEFDAEFVIK